MRIINIQQNTLNSHMVHDMPIEQRFRLQIQHQMEMIMFMIRFPMLLITIAESMKTQQGM